MGKALLKLLHGFAPSWLYKAKSWKTHSRSLKLLPFFRAENGSNSSDKPDLPSPSSLISTADAPLFADGTTNQHDSLPISANALKTPREDLKLSKADRKHPKAEIQGHLDNVLQHSDEHILQDMVSPEDRTWLHSQGRLACFDFEAELQSSSAEQSCSEMQIDPEYGQDNTCNNQYKYEASGYCDDAYPETVQGLKRKLEWLQNQNGKEGGEEGERCGAGSRGDSKRWVWKRRKGQNGLMSCNLPESICDIVGNGRAVVKQSSDPHVAVWESMVEMIVGNGLWELGNLEFLLFCYLSLNEPHLHSIIQSSFLQVLKDLHRIP